MCNLHAQLTRGHILWEREEASSVSRCLPFKYPFLDLLWDDRECSGRQCLLWIGV